MKRIVCTLKREHFNDAAYFILQKRLHVVPVKYQRVHDFKSLA